MKLSEVFSQLTYGELSQLNLGGAEAGAIDEANYAAVVAHTNLALTALYKRFPLKENRVAFTLQTGRTTYPLDTDEDVLFIEDGSNPDFANDILKIEKVMTVAEYELSLNDASNIYSCFTPSASVLRIPAIVATPTADLPIEYVTPSLTVVYRANHPILVHRTGFNPARVNLELPYTHLEPLLYFIASRVNNPIGMTNEFHVGNSYAAKYEQACALLEFTNLNVDQGSQNTRAAQNGWV